MRTESYAVLLTDLARAGLPVPQAWILERSASNEAILSTYAALAGGASSIRPLVADDAAIAPALTAEQLDAGADVDAFTAAVRRALEASPAAIVLATPTPEASGVAYTMDPVAHDHAVVVTEAWRGAVAKATTPDLYVIDKRTRAVTQRTIIAAAPVLDDAAIAAVAALAVQAEHVAEAPIAVDWSASGGDVVIVGARPVMALQHAH